jgi:putative effector of murein hydrolase
MSKNKTAGVFAALAMGLSGIATSIFVIIILKIIL